MPYFITVCDVEQYSAVYKGGVDVTAYTVTDIERMAVSGTLIFPYSPQNI
jgi:hypothetical protein